MKMNIKWKGNMAFEGTGDSGRSLLMDAGLNAGGEDLDGDITKCAGRMYRNGCGLNFKKNAGRYRIV